MARQYKLARKMKKIALTAAAKELGISQPTLSSWESERKAPSIEGLIRMSEYYHVSTDFLLGLTTESDPRKDWIEPVDPSVLPALHETPVYVPEKGWAFVDAVEKGLRFADGSVMQNEAVKEVFIIPPAYALPAAQEQEPIPKDQLQEYDEVWVEPISADHALREELRGWYHMKGRYVENEVGQRFYMDFYGAKWLAFSEMGGTKE